MLTFYKTNLTNSFTASKNFILQGNLRNIIYQCGVTVS